VDTQSFLKRFKFVGPLSGQTMVIFALALPALIGMLGLGIDAAHMFQERRSLQNAADLAALAGASQLPGDPAAAQSVAADIAAENGFADGVTVTVPYDDDPMKIEVEITAEVGTFFMPALGLPSVDISARSVASHEVSGDGAILAKKDYHCWEGTVTWSGSNITINGNVHSNGGMILSGHDNTVTGELTYKVGLPVYPHDGEMSCHHDVYDSDGSLDPEESPWYDWPVLYTNADFPCTFTLPSTNGDVTQDGAWWQGGEMDYSYTLNNGVICFNASESSGRRMTLHADGIKGNVTFRAKKIDVSGDNQELIAHTNGVLFFSDSTSFPAMRLEPNRGTWEGIIYNFAGSPTATVQGGQIRLEGSSGFHHSGSIIGWAVTLAGSNWTLAGNDAPVYQPMRIVE